MASHTSCFIAFELDSGYIAGCYWQSMRKTRQKDSMVRYSLFIEFIHSIHTANSDSQVKYDFFCGGVKDAAVQETYIIYLCHWRHGI